MANTAPHYLLFSETKSRANKHAAGGAWRFVLQRLDGSDRLVVSDREPGVWGERLQLLTVIRGLQALDQPSRVTLITGSRYVNHGIRRGLAAWKECHWQWERFGELRPIANQDLWQKYDHAAGFHDVVCRKLRAAGGSSLEKISVPATKLVTVARASKRQLARPWLKVLNSPQTNGFPVPIAQAGSA